MIRIRDIPLGPGQPLALIAGLNVIEDAPSALACADRVQRACDAAGLPLVFKASFDKANRSSHRSVRGPGLDEGLRVLTRVTAATGLPLLTDVHEPGEAKPAADVVDCLQIPAYLCRQLDLIEACARTDKPLNIKKGQFMAPADMRHPVENARHWGAPGVFVTERGTTFGHNDLVVDLRGLAAIRPFAPVCFDATHSVQRPGALGDRSGGDRTLVAPLARAAVAFGVDAVFVEVHAVPDEAPCDGPSQIDFVAFEALVRELRSIESALRSPSE